MRMFANIKNRQKLEQNTDCFLNVLKVNDGECAFLRCIYVFKVLTYNSSWRCKIVGVQVTDLPFAIYMNIRISEVQKYMGCNKYVASRSQRSQQLYGKCPN